MTVSFENVTITPINDEPGHSQVYINGTKVGTVEADIFAICFKTFCYENSNAAPFENAAHFVWTLYNSYDWDGVIDFSGDGISHEEIKNWKAANAANPQTND